MKNKIILGALALLTAATSFAQDVNFSQMNQLPVLLNPANTGAFNKQYRINAVFRNTTFNEANAFTSGAFTAEKRLSEKSGIDANDGLGMGISGVFDQSGNGALSSSYFGFSLAYTKSLNAAGTSMLSAGVQGVWASRRLDVNKLVFQDQFTSGGYNAQMPSADAYRSGALNYLDLHTGLSYRYATAKNGFNLGAAVYHIGRPKEQFWGEGYQLPRRYLLNGGGYFSTANNDQVHLSMVSNFQGKATEHLLGAYYSKSIATEENKLQLNIGSYYRLNNAIIPYVGVAFSNWNAGISYDVQSGNAIKTGNRRSLEISMQHIF